MTWVDSQAAPSPAKRHLTPAAATYDIGEFQPFAQSDATASDPSPRPPASSPVPPRSRFASGRLGAGRPQSGRLRRLLNPARISGTRRRIATDTPTYAASDLSGTGAEKTGGRWNHKGTPMLYTSVSRALACLETVVHIGAGGMPLNRYLVEITIPESLWNLRFVFDATVYVGWDALPPGKASMDWGTTWIRTKKQLLAEVPSVIVQEERNILINPTHPDAAKLTAFKVRKWTYDPRL